MLLETEKCQGRDTKEETPGSYEKFHEGSETRNRESDGGS